MIVIPAVDIRGGRCVRLRQGRVDQETVYSERPEEMAKRWASSGATLLHVVDLDGALSGTPQNRKAIEVILSSVKVDIEVGGGIRTVETIEDYLSAGVRRVVLGSSALMIPGFLREACRRFPGKIAVGIDSLDGKLMVRGWTMPVQENILTVATRVEEEGPEVIISTDIKRDGMLAGPDLGGLLSLVEAVKIPVIASGGVATVEDVQALKGIGVSGVIIGKALYEGTLDLCEAIAAAHGT